MNGTIKNVLRIIFSNLKIRALQGYLLVWRPPSPLPFGKIKNPEKSVPLDELIPMWSLVLSKKCRDLLTMRPRADGMRVTLLENYYEKIILNSISLTKIMKSIFFEFASVSGRKFKFFGTRVPLWQEQLGCYKKHSYENCWKLTRNFLQNVDFTYQILK